MADDINSYALNLAFQLQTGTAIASLGDILSSITNIQKGIQQVSTALSAPVTKSLAFIQEQVAKITVSSTDISKNAAQLATDLDAVQRHYAEIDRLNTKTAKTGLKSFLDFDKMRKWIPQLLKEQRLLSNEAKTQSIQQEKITDAVKTSRTAGGEVIDQADMYAGSSQNIAAIWQGINNAGSQSVRQGKNQVAIGEQVAAAWANSKNNAAGLAESSEKAAGIGGIVAAAWSGVADRVRATVVGFAEMLVGITAIKTAFAGFVDEENRFNTANYRLYGQQKEIIGQVNKLTVQYGLMRRPAMEAMTILGSSIRDTDDQLTAMVNTNVQFSKILGVNQKDLADWQRAMKSMGIKDADALLMKYADTMRQLGMTAAQMGRILGEQAKSAAVMNQMFGPEGTKALNEYSVRLTGFANKMGMSTEQVDQLQTGLGKLWSDPQAMTAIKNMGAAIVEAYDTLSPAEKAKADLMAYTKVMFDSYDKIEDATIRQIAIEQGATRVGMDRQAFMALRQLSQFKDNSGKTINMLAQSTKDMDDIIAKQSKHMRDAAYAEALKAGKGMQFLYNEATSSISDRFAKMWTKIEDAWSNFFIAIEPALTWLLSNVLEPLIDAISFVINLVSGSLTPAASKTAETLNKVSKSAAPVVGWFEKTVQVLGSLGVLLGGVVAGFVALGTALAIIGGGIALWWIFMKVTDATKLMAIAAAALAVGAGVLAIAFAIKMLADLDYGKLWSAVGALAVVFGLLALAVLGMSTGVGGAAAIALAGVLLAIAAASLIAAAAAYVISLAFDNVVKSLVELYDVTGGGWGMVGFGLALVAFGVELALAAVTIGVGASLMALATIPLIAGMAGLSIAMFLLSDSAVEKMVTLSGGTLQKFGDSLRSLGPGITSFISAMGYGIEFSSGMKGLASGINQIDPAQTMAAGSSLTLFGRALESLSKFDMTDAFANLLLAIPVIADVTDRIAAAIEAGQNKIRSQMDALTASFVALELIANRLGVSASIEETDKKKVMAETISTVQVKTETAGSATGRWKQEEMQQKQIDVMSTIAESVEKLSVGNLDDIGIIKTLLQTYLPKLGESPSKLSTRLNNWS